MMSDAADNTTAAVATTKIMVPPTAASKTILEALPENRFELELEFVQSLASPAYLHYLATNHSTEDHTWLDDPEFLNFLRYLLDTWSRPEYNRYLVYPQALYFLEWFLNHHQRDEWAQVAFRNFAHQQQFMTWQHRAARLYGVGSTKPKNKDDEAAVAAAAATAAAAAVGSLSRGGPILDPTTGLEVDQQPKQEG